MCIKHRPSANAVDSISPPLLLLPADVKGRDVVIVDDMIDTARTLCLAAGELSKAGAGNIYAYATHGVLSGGAMERIEKSGITV